MTPVFPVLVFPRHCLATLADSSPKSGTTVAAGK
jgi:hypothetical protein